MKMKASTGWVVMTRSEVVVLQKGVQMLNTAGGWTSICKERPKFDKGGRNHCERCDIKWSDIPAESPTFNVFTNKGPKIVCETCYNEVKTQP